MYLPRATDRVRLGWRASGRSGQGESGRGARLAGAEHLNEPSLDWGHHMARADRGYQPGFYGQSAALHDAESRRIKAAKVVHCLRQAGALPLRDHAVGLDLGCANGFVVDALAPELDRLMGLDYDREALLVAHRAGRTGSGLVHGDAMALPLVDESCDLVICAQVYEHVPDDQQLVREVFRVLKPGGVVFFSGPNWLFPIEGHYHLPFLHWLPPRVADRWLQRLGRGDRYYERTRTWWSLRRLWHRFEVRDVTTEAMHYVWRHSPGRVAAVGRRVPRWFWRLGGLLVPNFNWILTKQTAPCDGD